MNEFNNKVLLNKYISPAEEQRIEDLENILTKYKVYNEINSEMTILYDVIKKNVSEDLLDKLGRYNELIQRMIITEQYFFYRNGFIDGANLKEVLNGIYNINSQLNENKESARV